MRWSSVAFLFVFFLFVCLEKQSSLRIKSITVQQICYCLLKWNVSSVSLDCLPMPLHWIDKSLSAKHKNWNQTSQLVKQWQMNFICHCFTSWLVWFRWFQGDKWILFATAWQVDLFDFTDFKFLVSQRISMIWEN